MTRSDARADQYALAATAYQLLTGEPLFPSSDPAEVINDHLNSKPPTLAATRPELAALDPVLTVALSKRPESRFARCSDFARALSESIAALGPRSAVAPPNYGPPPAGDTFANLFTEPLTVDPRAVAGKPKRFPVGPVVAAGVAAVVVGALAVWALWPSSGGSDSSAADAHVDYDVDRSIPKRSNDSAARYRRVTRPTPARRSTCRKPRSPRSAVPRTPMRVAHRRRRSRRSRTSLRCKRRSAQSWPTSEWSTAPATFSHRGRGAATQPRSWSAARSSAVTGTACPP